MSLLPLFINLLYLCVCLCAFNMNVYINIYWAINYQAYTEQLATLSYKHGKNTLLQATTYFHKPGFCVKQLIKHTK